MICFTVLCVGGGLDQNKDCHGLKLLSIYKYTG